MIDALTVCFEVENRYHFDRISSLDYGEVYGLYEFQLSRIEGRYYDNVYVITYMDDDMEIEFGQLKFNISRGAELDNLHENGNPKV